MHLTYPIQHVGRLSIAFIRELGRTTVFLFISLLQAICPPFKIPFILKQTYFIGVKSITIIVLTGLFTGMVLSLNSYYVLNAFGAESKLGSIVAMSLIRELGPVITALMVIGRAGSALTAEIGIMRISEQIDAIESMALNPYKYLVSPNMWAGLIALPVLSAFFIAMGIWGGYLVGVKLTGLSSGLFFGAIAESVDSKDIILCLYKSLSFGVLISWICCYKGFYAGCGTGFGAQGVSKATTDAVVLSSVVILIWDYFLTSIMLLN